MKPILFAALLFWTASSQASCLSYLTDSFGKIATTAKGLVGFSENVPIRQQSLARGNSNDYSMSWNWIVQEIHKGGTIQQIIRSGPPLRTNWSDGTTEDIYSDIQKFILTVPNWKSLTSKQLRVFVEMDRVLTFFENQIPESRIPAYSDWTYSQRDEWNRMFPNRPLWEALEGLHMFHPG